MATHRTVVLAVLVGLALAACSAGRSDLPGSITCHTQYRPDAETLDGAREPSLTVERADGTGAQPQRLDFATLALEVTYQGAAPEGDHVTVVVATAQGEPLVRDLYQLTDGVDLRREFAGGHGFTGLQYVFHEQASLQVWCAADG